MNRTNQIRNFVIISHVDHGKSTLADRFLEISRTVPKEKMRSQYLDMMDLERERGVTIKMAPVRIIWKHGTSEYILNLIDTPGHADFSYEVSRALTAVEGAILLVDATQGVQAQTLINLDLAQKENLKIIPVINKIDSPYVDVGKTIKELESLGFKNKDIIKISAKTGENVETVLKALIIRIPPPQIDERASLKALIFDSIYDPYKGVIAYIRVFDGEVKKGERIKFLAAKLEPDVLEVGYFKPQFVPSEKISAGEIGYIKTSLKDISDVKIGDTVSQLGVSNINPLAGYKEPKPMVYASIYPTFGGDFKKLKDALSKLKLNDASLSFQSESSKVLGAGFRCGFLGLFHLEITKERLERDSDLDVVITRPAVDVKKFPPSSAKGRATADQPKFLTKAEDTIYQEPYVLLEIVTPNEHIGKVMELAKIHRSIFKEMRYLADRVIVTYEAPLSEIIIEFYDELKNVSSGYASMNYQFIGFREADLVQLDVLIAREKFEPLSQIVPREKAESIGRNLISKLKDLIPRQLFEISLQAAIGGKIVAREDIPALRKDVTAKLYGGDITRKTKLLEKQAKGKKKMKQIGKVQLPSDIFLKLIKR